MRIPTASASQEPFVLGLGSQEIWSSRGSTKARAEGRMAGFTPHSTHMNGEVLLRLGRLPSMYDRTESWTWWYRPSYLWRCNKTPNSSYTSRNMIELYVCNRKPKPPGPATCSILTSSQPFIHLYTLHLRQDDMHSLAYTSHMHCYRGNVVDAA